MKKLVVSLLFCAIGFAGGFMMIDIPFRQHGIYLFWNLSPPLAICLAYGGRYALLAAFTSALFPVFLFPGFGWGSVAAAFCLSAWFLVHGWAADKRSSGDKNFLFDAFVVQAFYSIAEILVVFFVFPFVLRLNPAFWSAAAPRDLPWELTLGIIYKSLLNNFGSLIIADAILRFPSVRDLLGLPRHAWERLNAPILLTTLVICLFAWFLFCYFASYLNGTPISAAFSLSEPHVALFLIIVLGGGLFAGNMSSRFSERRLRMELVLKENEEKITRTLEEKDLLFRELQHRVKNNLSMIESLLSLQSMRSDDPTIKTALTDAKSRVGSLTLIYEQLYRSQDLRTVNLRTYLESLVAAIRSAYSHLPRIAIKTRLEDISSDLKHAVPLGFILNELLTNAIKHAYPEGREGVIRIELERDSEDVFFIVADDGIGIPEAYVEGKEGSLGIVLVRTLADQLKGKLEIARDKGTTISLKIPATVLKIGEPA